ncbi:MAG: hypothetical protein EA397_15145 [Deltaproteobacteria bacterium]|nr:MAG: hypothetical protein EA397_15145 [Deltaproteobacteria bacterium]
MRFVIPVFAALLGLFLLSIGFVVGLFIGPTSLVDAPATVVIEPGVVELWQPPISAAVLTLMVLFFSAVGMVVFFFGHPVFEAISQRLRPVED